VDVIFENHLYLAAGMIPSLINHFTRIPEFWLQNFVSHSLYLDMTRAPTRFFSLKIQKFVKCESVNLEMV